MENKTMKNLGRWRYPFIKNPGLAANMNASY